MPNTDAPFGLDPLYGVHADRCHMYRITNNYGTALYIQDPVRLSAGGTAERVAATAEYLLGAIIAIFKQNGPITYRPENLEPVVYMPATPGATYDYWALVCDYPDQRFRVQDDGDTSQIAMADLGLNCNLIFTHTGNITSGLSGAELDSSSINTTATLPMRLLELSPEWDARAGQWNTYNSANGKWICSINLHQLRYTTGL